MKKNTLSIDIQKPVSLVFSFTVNPRNTPKWIPSILEEKTSEKKVRVGTIYRQKVRSGKKGFQRTALVVTGFLKNKFLAFHLVNGEYTCSYRYQAIPKGTRLTYSEENGVNGQIDSPMSRKNLRALKKLVEEA